MMMMMMMILDEALSLDTQLSQLNNSGNRQTVHSYFVIGRSRVKILSQGATPSELRSLCGVITPSRHILGHLSVYSKI
jgi:hypothetical protein